MDVLVRLQRQRVRCIHKHGAAEGRAPNQRRDSPVAQKAQHSMPSGCMSPQKHHMADNSRAISKGESDCILHRIILGLELLD